MSSARPLIAALLVALVLGGAAWLAVSTLDRREAPEFATVLPERRPLPEFSLVDHEGRAFTRDRLEGRTSLLFFGFTHCPDICPATLQQLATARRQLAAEVPAGQALQIVLISVDPERDTPEALARYVRHFGDGVTGVTGDVDELRALTEPLGIHFEKQGDGERYAINHSTAVLVVDRHGALQALFGTPHRVDAFVHDVPLLMAAQ